MPEPAVPQEEKELTFKTEEEKIVHLEKMQQKGVTVDDLPEIERVQNAPVLEKPEQPSPAEDLVEPETPPEKPVEVDGKPTQEEKPTDEARNWTITEDLISKYNETYVDDSGRERPIFTHKDPEALLKSFADSQKHINYMKKKHAREVQSIEQAAIEKVKAEYEAKLAEFQKKPPEQQPTAQPPQPAQPTPVQPGIFEEYNKLAEEVGKIPEGDEIEHMDKIRRFSELTPKILAEKERLSSEKINQLESKFEGQFNSFKTDWETKQQQAAQEKENERIRLENEQKIEGVYRQIDEFAASKTAPPEVRLDQPFKEALSEATAFHNELAELYTGKTARDYSKEDWSKYMEYAGTAYLNQLPELMQKISSTGMQEPRNYKQWVLLDNIEAMKVGYIRDPQTGEWTQKFDENTGKPVNFPDMESAYNYYLDKSGKREELRLAEKKQDSAELLHAINKRDNGVVQLDDSKLVEDGDGGALTEEDAVKILQTSDVPTAKQQAMQGHPEMLNTLNAAMVRLGNPPVELERSVSLNR